MSNIKIMVAAHKKFAMPEDRKLYLPVLVGASRNYTEGIDFQRDDDGENISYKNPNYNELTAVYWGWKNLDNVDAVGLVQYRRLFSSSDNRGKNSPLSKMEVEKLLKYNDVILPKKRNYFIETNRSHYIHAHEEIPLIELEKVIRSKYPDYLKSFEVVMKNHKAHMFNMFIMNKKYFNSYSFFIFNVLRDLESKIDIDSYSDQEARVYGYLSELLMDVWILSNKVKYVEVPWYQVGEKHTIKKLTYFIFRKFGFKKGDTHF